jgi:hypothetical protein
VTGFRVKQFRHSLVAAISTVTLGSLAVMFMGVTALILEVEQFSFKLVPHFFF